MDNKRLEDYNRELQAAVNNLKQMISQAQVSIGVMEAFLYLVRKESSSVEDPALKKEGN